MNLQNPLPRSWAIIAILCVVCSLLPGCVGPRRVSDRDIRVVSMSEVAKLMDGQRNEPGERLLLILDSRAEAKYAEAHLPGAKHLLLSGVDPNMKRDKWMDSFEEIVVYADNPGSASARALVKRMLRMRYDNVRLFPGGFDQWSKAGLPVEAGE